jgi:plasmid maintenance system antidote protein VapI
MKKLAKRKAAAKKKTVVSPTMREVILQSIKESGKPVVAIALAAGVAQPVLSRFVQGKRGLSLESAEKVCSALGLKLVKDDSAD